MQAQDFRVSVVCLAKSVPVPFSGIGTHVPPDCQNFLFRQVDPVLNVDYGRFTVPQQIRISILIASIRFLDVISGFANVVEQGCSQDCVLIAPCKLRHILAQFQCSPRYVERV